MVNTSCSFYPCPDTQSQNVTDSPYKRFTISCSEHPEIHSYEQAIEYFKKWQKKYYPNDEPKIRRITHERTFVISYTILPKQKSVMQPRLNGYGVQ